MANSRLIQRSLRAAYYRGGTSRAVILQPQHLPANRKKWPTIFRQLMGSGDPYGRQLDGMGAGISSLSKICLVEPYRTNNTRNKDSSNSPAHVDYTFVGLGIENNEVDTFGNCGNMSSAIGPYAFNAGLLPAHLLNTTSGDITITIRNTNTNKLIDSTFSIIDGQAAVAGDYSIDGVSTPGSKIKLAFKHPYGSKTGKVLPTGNKTDILLNHTVSCIDGPNPAIFIHAADLGIDGAILPNAFAKLTDQLHLLEQIRAKAAVAMGLVATESSVARTIPKIGLVSASTTHKVLSGATLPSSETDLVVRFLSDTQPHRAVPLTAALTTAIAARIPGSVVHELLAPTPVVEGAITIGHASGRVQVDAVMHREDPVLPLSASVYRTAKRLFEGDMYWVDSERSGGGVAGEGGGCEGSGESLGMAFVEDCRRDGAGSGFPF
ncbi:unnamed protein product [Periconia digitata]|uniref:DUF453-domain-containing protein n=1 Tax=Periconia digitata TaxID=1303443 RepID=A0A9W4UNG1_9PLEO|nr:unnamed protein product [Periconia digitata]